FSRDWSSDVCSSDLLFGHAVVEVLQGFALDQRAVDFSQAFAGFTDDGLQATQIQWALATVGLDDANARVRLGDLAADAGVLALQIGRASCRGRGSAA